MDKQIKKHILAQAQSLFAEPPPGLEKVCFEELRSLLAGGEGYKFSPSLTLEESWIKITSIDYRQGMELVYSSRLCRNIWWQLLDIHVGSFGELSKALAKVRWDLILPTGAGISLEVKSFQSKLYHEGKIKEMAHDFFLEQGYNGKSDSFIIQLIQKANRLKILISLGGDDLYKRGFKTALATRAPLAEHLAAALLQDLQIENQLVWVPFAGSGTLGFEAIFLRDKIAPACFGRSYAMERLRSTPAATTKHLRDKCRQVKHAEGELVLMDILPKQCQELEGNLRQLKTFLPQLADVQVVEGDFFNWPLDAFRGRSVVMPLNPPYGIRLASGQGLFKGLAEKILEISGICQSLSGFCLLPDEDSYCLFRAILGPLYLRTSHINQGGRHIRAVYFGSLSQP